MSDSDLNDTVPMRVGDDPLDQTQPVAKPRSRWKLFALLGVLAILIILVISGFVGYQTGINNRLTAEESLVIQKAAEQFDLAVSDIDAGQFQRARERLEYVARIDPNYPGLTEKLAVVLTWLNTTATPTPVPTPTIAPTIDNSGIEGLLNQAQQFMLNGDWSNTIDTILTLRKQDPGFHAVELDGMLFLALRNRGIDKISKEADLEGGMYDLTLASLFSPLDNEAQGFMNWTSLYITGASFWELDWVKVLEYFQQVGPALPGLRDRSGLTARERYRLALKFYGLQLFDSGDVCSAAEQLQLSLTIGPDPEVESALSDATLACVGDQTGEPGEPPLETPSAPVPPPIETTPAPVETPTPYPPP